MHIKITYLRVLNFLCGTVLFIKLPGVTTRVSGKSFKWSRYDQLFLRDLSEYCFRIRKMWNFDVSSYFSFRHCE